MVDSLYVHAAGPDKNATALVDVRDSYTSTCDNYSGMTWSSMAATIRAGQMPDK